jgi:hypothetical protein
MDENPSVITKINKTDFFTENWSIIIKKVKFWLKNER